MSSVALFGGSLLYTPITFSAQAEYALMGDVAAALRFRVVLRRARAHFGPLLALSLRAAALTIGVFAACLVPVAAMAALSFALGGDEVRTLVGVLIIVAYPLGLAVLASVSGAASLVTYRMLGGYAREAFDLPRPPVASAA
jgi:hypothetical protein